MPSIKEIQQQVARYLASVRGTERHKVCPLCDGQGELIEVGIEDCHEPLLICDECDSLWKVGNPIDERYAQNFGDFMKERGKQGLWTELSVGNGPTP
jgi:hypothetical protein